MTFGIKSKIYSLTSLSCFVHILNYKMSLFFGFCFFLYWLIYTPSFSSLLMLINNSKSRNNSPCFKVTSLHVSNSSVTSFPPSTCKCKKLFTRKNRRTNSWPNRYKLRFFNRNSVHWKPDMRVHVLNISKYAKEFSYWCLIYGHVYLSMDCWERQ